MSDTPTQSDALLRYLQRHGRISDMEALTELGIRRVAARVFDLRKQGWCIRTERMKVITRRGEAFVADYIIDIHPQGELAI